MSATLPEPTALIASLLKLMTHFSCLGCPKQAALIRHELALFRRYPDALMPPLLKQVGHHLEQEWAQLHLAISDEISDEPAGISAHPLSLH